MQGEIQIGVVVPAAIGLGREILFGLRGFCDVAGKAELRLISNQRDLPEGKEKKFPLDVLVCFHSGRDFLEKMMETCPRVISVSNQNRVTVCPQVVSDDTAVGRLAAEALILRGYNHLVYVGPSEPLFAHERAGGFEHFAKGKGLAVRRLDLDDPLDAPSAAASLDRGVKPAGVFAASDLHARWILSAMSNPRSLVPSKFALIGVDNDPMEQALSPIGFSSVMLAGRQIGYQAAKIGRDWVQGIEPPSSVVNIPPIGIARRASTQFRVFDDPLVSRCLKQIEENLTTLTDVDDVVNALNVNRRTLELHLGKHLGLGVAQLLRNARIEKARDLLSTSDLSMKEVSYLVGFPEPRMLSLVFKRETGETPTDYRNRVRGTLDS
ncbi:MAG: helix-turn-helix domain-containing protein [Verrucomicrobia bacterium]|nr:helix-turn-helix domain-containing protein [Verrucomicrobiota bacterium]MCH8525802.1 helix-turn-helix domain-containing protein [Kiritimatiellia bacterium]